MQDQTNFQKSEPLLVICKAWKCIIRLVDYKLSQRKVLYFMQITLDDYRCKLINKILFASSQQEVKRFVNAAMKSLQEHNVNGHVIARFVEKAIKNLEAFRPVDYNTQQWTNIHYARMHFYNLQESGKPIRNF